MDHFLANCVYNHLICDPETYATLMSCGVLLRDSDSKEMNIYGSNLIKFLNSESVLVRDL